MDRLAAMETHLLIRGRAMGFTKAHAILRADAPSGRKPQLPSFLSTSWAAR
jgi:hypothetical protein